MNKNKSSRYFSIVTYLSELQLYSVLCQHASSLRSWVYIEHNQDTSEPHIHLLLRTYNTWYPDQVRKWFLSYFDVNGKSINTFCEKASNIESLISYILHDTDEAREKGKYQYSADSLRWSKDNDFLPRKDCADDTYQILNDYLLRISPREMVRKYGRDFVYHFSQYQAIADEIYNREGVTTALEIAKKNAEGFVFSDHDPEDDLPF